MQLLKKGKYSFFVKKENGNYIVYSSLSGAVIVFNDKKYIEMLEEILDKDVFDYIDNEFYNLMLNKMIFVDDSVDEDLLVRGIFEEQVIRSSSLEIMLIVTRQCNFRCVYCGQAHFSEYMDKKIYDAVLSFIKDQIIARGYTSVYVTFFGGEPLIESDEICIFLGKLRNLLTELSTEQRPITYRAGMSTNGYLLTPQLFESLNELNCNFFQISVDGMSEIHDKLRPLVSGDPTWNRIIDNLRYMVSTDKQFTVQLRTNFNADVAESLVEFYSFISQNLKDKRINIYYETIKNQGNEMTPNTLCGIEELVFDVDIAQLIRENDLVCNNCTARLMPCSRMCYASKPNHFVINQKGEILKCSFALEDSNNIIGRLNYDGFFISDNQKYINWVYRDYLTSENCKSCKALPLCFGKRCPKTFIQLGEMQCDTDIIQAEIEGLLDSYYQ